MVRDFLREGNDDVKVDEKVVGRLTGILVRTPCHIFTALTTALPCGYIEIQTHWTGIDVLSKLLPCVQASIFCAAQFLTSYGWGVFSDNFGRKYVLLMSIMSGCISAIIFGMAGNYLTAAIARLFGGLFNATGG